MPYSRFTSYDALIQKFNLSEKKVALFEKLTPVPPGTWLRETLELSKHVSLLSKKARSELIVMPILVEIIRRNGYRISLFSGATLDVDRKQGLTGECDFLLSNKPDSYFVSAPIFAMVEAKKNDIDLGVPQCLAQMLGAQLFNKNHNAPIDTIYGCVTTSETWQFMKLTGQKVEMDSLRYYLVQLEEILGVLQTIVDFYKDPGSIEPGEQFTVRLPA